MDYGSVWARKSLRGPYSDWCGVGPNADDRDPPEPLLAGTVSVAQDHAQRHALGFQFLFGVDYALTDAMSLGLKGRYVMFDSFIVVTAVSFGIRYGVTRHICGKTTPNRIRAVSTNNIQFFGISLNLKYHF